MKWGEKYYIELTIAKKNLFPFAIDDFESKVIETLLFLYANMRYCIVYNSLS